MVVHEEDHLPRYPVNQPHPLHRALAKILRALVLSDELLPLSKKLPARLVVGNADVFRSHEGRVLVQ